MSRDRVVSTAAETPQEETANVALRPARIAEYIGQPELIARLSIALEAVQARGEAMEHVLLHGPPGLGKTTIAMIIAHQLSAPLRITSGPAIQHAGDLAAILTNLEPRDVLFIDEIHRLSRSVEEILYPAMEDFRVDFTVDSGLHARTVTINLQPFTLIGATTRAGLLTQPLRSRFGIAHHLGFYGAAELASILRRAAKLLSIAPPAEVERLIAERSRGTPRIALRLLRRVRDFAQVRADGVLDAEVVEAALALEGIDGLGLDELDRKYLRTLGGVYEGGPAGLEAIAASMGDDAATLEDLVEPYLLQVGFLARTRQGRLLTPAAKDHLGLSAAASGGDLFERSLEASPE